MIFLCRRLFGFFVDSRLLAAGASGCVAAAALARLAGAGRLGLPFLLIGLPACLWASVRAATKRA